MPEITDSQTDEILYKIEHPESEHNCDFRLAKVRNWKLENMTPENTFGDRYYMFTLRCECGKHLVIKSKEIEINNG